MRIRSGKNELLFRNMWDNITESNTGVTEVPGQEKNESVRRRYLETVTIIPQT